MPKKFPPFKIKNGFLAIFVNLAKSQKWSKIHFFFWKVEICLTHLNHLGRLKFFIFYTFWFNKKNGQNWKKVTFVHSPFFQFLAQKCQKYQFSWKNLFLRISVRKDFLYFWRTPIFEPARAILLRRVWYQALQMGVLWVGF